MASPYAWHPRRVTAIKRISQSLLHEVFPLKRRPLPPLPSADQGKAEVLRAQARAVQSVPPSVRVLFSDAELLELKHGFDQVDTDGSNAIDGQELHTALRSSGKLGQAISHDNVTKIITAYSGRGEAMLRKEQQEGDGSETGASRALHEARAMLPGQAQDPEGGGSDSRELEDDEDEDDEDAELSFSDYVCLVRDIKEGKVDIPGAAALGAVLPGGNEITKACEARLERRTSALQEANDRLEARRVFLE